MTYIKQMQNDKAMLLIDTRDEEWYGYRSIPGAINMHYVYIMMSKSFDEEFNQALVRLGVLGTKKPYDFSHAKSILLFCNGGWCSQSPQNDRSITLFGISPRKDEMVSRGNE